RCLQLPGDRGPDAAAPRHERDVVGMAIARLPGLEPHLATPLAEVAPPLSPREQPVAAPPHEAAVVDDQREPPQPGRGAAGQLLQPGDEVTPVGCRLRDELPRA